MKIQSSEKFNAWIWDVQMHDNATPRTANPTPTPEMVIVLLRLAPLVDPSASTLTNPFPHALSTRFVAFPNAVENEGPNFVFTDDVVLATVLENNVRRDFEQLEQLGLVVDGNLQSPLI